MITSEQIKKVYQLAMLEMPNEEEDVLVKKFQVTYDFAARVEDVDTDGVEPLEMTPTYDCPLRDDVIEPSMDREVALSQAPDREFGYIRVKKVLEDGDGK